VNIGQPVTIADGLRASEPGELTFPINEKLLADVVTVPDEAIIEVLTKAAGTLRDGLS